MENAKKPTLVINPADDEVFGGIAHLLVDHGAASTEELEHRLRTEYPETSVHRRELTGEANTIWYVYRDGHWLNSSSRDRSREIAR